MKKFLHRIIIYTLLTLLVAVISDVFISYQLRHSKSRVFYAWNSMYELDDTIDIVINGNSRAWVQYNPLIIGKKLKSKVFNLGIDGSNFNRQWVKYQTYCGLHGHPKYVIQNIDFFTLQPTYGYEREQFFPFFLYDTQLISKMDEYEHFTFGEKYIPFYRYIGYSEVIQQAINLMDSTSETTLTNGFCSKDESWDGTALNSIDSITFYVDSTTLNDFKDFLSFTQIHNTQVILVSAPLYIDAIKKVSNYDEYIRTITDLSNKYNIPLFEYSFDTISYNTDYFYNATHLNTLGSTLFSNKLANDMLSSDYKHE